MVVSGALSLPRDGHLAETARRIPLWLCHDQEAEPARRKAWTELGAELIEIPFQADGQLDLSAMMQRLGERGLTRVLCEGGGRLAAALIEDDLVDEVVCYTAGLVLGADAIPAIGRARGGGAAARAALPPARGDADRPRPAQPLAPPRLTARAAGRRLPPMRLPPARGELFRYSTRGNVR